jgi:hypothetical protein
MRPGHAGLEQTERCLIPARAFVIRFPDGDFEYDFTRSVAPSVGDTLRRLGTTWRVTRRRQEDVLTIYVERVEHATKREAEAIATPEKP